MRRSIVVSIVNHKGGCLKTTLTVNLGAALARAGKNVLLIDLDAQQNLTSSLLGPQEYREGTQTLYDCICDELGLDHLITGTTTAGLDVVPCTEDFMGADLTLVSAVGRESMFSACLRNTARLPSQRRIDTAPHRARRRRSEPAVACRPVHSPLPEPAEFQYLDDGRWCQQPTRSNRLEIQNHERK